MWPLYGGYLWVSWDYDGDGDDSDADEDVDDGAVTINDDVRWQLDVHCGDGDDYHDYMLPKLGEAYRRY